MSWGQTELAEMAGWISKTLISNYKGLIQQYLALNDEVGGRINLDYEDDLSKFFVVDKQGTGAIVEGIVYPYEMDGYVVMNWHTHPLSLQKNAKDGLPFQFRRIVPSYMDLSTLLQASIQ